MGQGIRKIIFILCQFKILNSEFFIELSISYLKLQITSNIAMKKGAYSFIKSF